MDNPMKSINSEVLVYLEFAQEPASAAINSNEDILITYEDAQYDQEGLEQTFGIYNSKLEPVVSYGQKIMPF
jgi:hypothetical protein